MKVKLTGIIEVQVEVETEIDDEHFTRWAGMTTVPEETLIPKYLREFTDEETEIWATVTMSDIRDGEVLTAEFVGVEVHGRG